MSVDGSEIEWQLERLEAHKTSTALIRLADNDLELHISGVVWDLFQSRITCRLQLQAEGALGNCLVDAGKLRSQALLDSGIDPKRLYPHGR